MMKVDGQCHCGDVKFTAEIDPAKVFVCHCTDCQTLSGSPFRVVAFGGSVEWQGAQPKKYIKVAESGNRRVQAFCGNCGTPIYSSDDVENPAGVAIRVGCLNQRDQLRPLAQMWCQSAQIWVLDSLTLPQFAKQAH